MWLGTDKVPEGVPSAIRRPPLEAFTFDIRETPHGVVQLHGYPYDAQRSTVIVEMAEDVWRDAGFAAGEELPPGRSDERSVAALEELFADLLDGHRLLANNSRGISFPTVRTERWCHGNVVLLGDAAHTAHFSIGSGTKLAMEDALSLVACLHECADLPTALAAYE